MITNICVKVLQNNLFFNGIQVSEVEVEDIQKEAVEAGLAEALLARQRLQHRSRPVNREVLAVDRPTVTVDTVEVDTADKVAMVSEMSNLNFLAEDFTKILPL